MDKRDEVDVGLKDVYAAGVARGQFATVEEARADFWAKLDRSIAQADAGQVEEIGIVWARLREELAESPRAAA